MPNPALIDNAYYNANFLQWTVPTNPALGTAPYLATNAARDLNVTALIEAVTAEFEKHCNQPLVQVSKTFTFAGNNKRSKLMPGYKVIALPTDPAFKRKSLSTPTDAYTTITGMAIAIEQEQGVTTLYADAVFDDTYRYSIDLNVGYAVADIPPDLKHLCAMRVKELYQQGAFVQGGDRFGLSSNSVTVDGVTRGTSYKDLSQYFISKLKPYRRIPV